MEVIAFFDMLRRHVYLIVAICVVTVIAGYGISFFSPLIPDRYEASAVVLVRPQAPVKIEPNSSGKEFLGFPVAQSPVIETASKTYIQIIQSPALVSEVVHRLKLDQKRPRKAVGDTISERIYASLRSVYDVIEPYLRDAVSLVRYGKVVEDDPVAKAVKEVRKGLTLKAYEDTYVFEIRYTGDDPQRTADIANTVASLFIEFLEKMRSAEAENSANRLRHELERSWRKLVQARETLSNYKETHQVFLYQPEYDAKLKVISDLTVELAKLDESWAASTVESSGYEKKRAVLLKVIGEKQAELTSLPTIERELQLMQADVNVADMTYSAVAKELKDAEIKSDAMPEASVVSPAVAPQLPSGPRRDIVLLACLVAGLLVGVGLALFLEDIDRTVRGIDDIEDATGLKVIGTIPTISRTLLRKRVGGSSPHPEAVRMSAIGPAGDPIQRQRGA